MKTLYYCLLILLAPLFANAANIPTPLEPWVDWVQKDQAHLNCPMINHSDKNQIDNFICAWPSALSINANQNGATFSQQWQVITPSWVTLPGSLKQWPHSVLVNGQTVAVMNRNNQPALYLQTGNRQIEGQFSWSAMPFQLKLPESAAAINLTLNQQSVEFAKIENNQLWLQNVTPDQKIDNAINVEVQRLVSDGSFLSLNSQIKLQVSGKIREEIIGHVLPEGFSLNNITSQLPAFIDQQGLLRIKVQPGSWTITVNAFAKQNLKQWKKPATNYYWPDQEIWAFASNDKFRLARITGGNPIDANLANLPSQWLNYPSYLMDDQSMLTLEEQHRGKPSDIENKLNLSRQLWLNFDSQQYIFNDEISGSMVSDWRLNLDPKFDLKAAQDQDGTILVSNINQTTGFENRYNQVDLKAQGQISFSNTLPASGWSNYMDSVNVELQLPPAHKLLAVFGADSSSGSWLNKWNLWNCFIVLFFSVLVFRLHNVVTGLLCLVTLILSYHLKFAPIFLLTLFILINAVALHQPFKKLKKLANITKLISLSLLMLGVIYFSFHQVRSILHPQLEHFSAISNSGFQQKTNLVRSQMESMPMSSMESDMAIPAPSSFKSMELNKPKAYSRYQQDVVLQAGLGKPNWSWNRYHISWQSPVSSDQSVSVYLLTPTKLAVIKLIALLFFLLLIAKLNNFSMGTLKGLSKLSTTSALAFVLLLPMFSEKSHAQIFPPQTLLDQLSNEINQQAPCTPHCANISDLTINATKDSLSLALTIHSQTNTAIALPVSKIWQASSYQLNEQAVNQLIRRNNWQYISVPKGISQLTIQGKIPVVEKFQLDFNEQPINVLSNLDGWQINSNKSNKKTIELVSLNQVVVANEENVSKIQGKSLVRLERDLVIDNDFNVTNRVIRLSPSQGAISLLIPLKEGEKVLTPNIEVIDGNIKINLSNNQNSLQWQSTMERLQQFQWQALDDSRIIEHWMVSSNPTWHVELFGPPQLLLEEVSRQYWVHHFYPHANETLDFNLSRPKAVEGAFIAIDQASVDVSQGSRSSTAKLSFDYRSTRGGQHDITIAQDYNVKEVRMDDRLIHIQTQDQTLSLPVSPGEHRYDITLRSEKELSGNIPQFDLKTPISNLQTFVSVPNNRWILMTKGPVIGPAVIYWSELVIFIICALILGRLNIQPLKTWQWLLLGFGLSTNAWSILIIVVAWFGAVQARAKFSDTQNDNWFNARQVLLFIFSIVALISLLAGITMGLLGDPDMGIVGNQSYGHQLNWFQDQSSGLTSDITLITAPLLLYKGIMLCWVMWLSFSLVSWVKWVWAKLGVDGYWREAPVKPKAASNKAAKPTNTDNQSDPQSNKKTE